MEISKKSRIIIALVSLFILLSMIQETYAKYITSASTNTNMTIARWNILINNQDITNNNTFTDKIAPIFPGSDYIAPNILAPLSEGYIDLIIDHTSVDVAFTETITLSHTEENTISDLKITGYSIDDGVVNYFTDSTIITNVIPINPITTNHKIRIYVKWLDGENETMDNAADTSATTNGNASIKIDVSFIQKAN